MGDWTDEDPRNECYPAAPKDPVKRQAWIDKRNLMIGTFGAARAVAASGASIGAPKDKKESK